MRDKIELFAIKLGNALSNLITINKMKKIILPMVVPLMFSCTSEHVKEKDCGCNEVVEVRTMNIVGSVNNPGNYVRYQYTTINQCTGVQRESSWSSQSVKIGDCR